MTSGHSSRLPAAFIGHGSPLNALERNQFTDSWRNWAQALPTKPKAILLISAHWYQPQLAITDQPTNQTIHDFYGFPAELANYAYPTKGDHELVAAVKQLLPNYPLQVTHDEWGIDHGGWSILTHMFPHGEVPVVQLSIDSRQQPAWHFQLGQQLAPLREQGILILASGNTVHNLSQLNWRVPQQGFDWAIAADQQICNLIKQQDFTALFNYQQLSSTVRQAIPTPEHFLPLLYILGSHRPNEPIEIFNQDYCYGSLAMTSVVVG